MNKDESSKELRRYLVSKLNLLLLFVSSVVGIIIGMALGALILVRFV